MSKIRQEGKKKKKKKNNKKKNYAEHIFSLNRIFSLHKGSHHLLRAVALFPKICLLFCGKQSALQNLGVVPKASIKKKINK